MGPTGRGDEAVHPGQVTHIQNLNAWDLPRRRNISLLPRVGAHSRSLETWGITSRGDRALTNWEEVTLLGT